jgi:chemotaxis protein CheZ
MNTGADVDVKHDSEELEALFDSIVASSRPQPAVAPSPARTHSLDACPAEKVIEQVGHLTRKLHETLRELGYDRSLQSAAQAIPDARERLAYVASKTEEAAVRCLNAIESAKPIQERVERDAAALASEWDELFDGRLGPDQFRDLARRTRTYLSGLPAETRATQAQLNEIMMAQDFQDLTGQVIKKISVMAQGLEQELLKLLIANVSREKREAAQSAGLLEGPIVGDKGRADVVTSQAQVDELLESLGF